MNKTFELSQTDLRQAQKIMLYIMKRIHEVCVKHNIKYWLDFGTLIGAVRHDGFIPWDDDMDICMLREDYEKFNKIAQTELGSDFFWQTPDSDPNFYLEMGKVRLCNTLWIEHNWQYANLKNYGLFVDIFPIDPFPESKIKMQYYANIANLCSGVLAYKKGHIESNCFINCMIQKTMAFLLPSSFFQNWLRRVTKQLQKYKNTSAMVSKLTDNPQANWCCKSMFENLLLKKFEDSEFYIPKEYDKRLRLLFGDYMTPPPESKRFGHHSIVKFNFGQYTDL